MSLTKVMKTVKHTEQLRSNSDKIKPPFLNDKLKIPAYVCFKFVL